MRVIFLDVDGVLITGKLGWNKPDPECVAALNRIIQQADAHIVVSSCWRVGRSVIELRELLSSWGVVGKVIDRTAESQEQRGHEIGKWLLARNKERGDVESFVILDDDQDMTDFMNQLVQTDPQVGLCDEHVKAAGNLLRGAAGNSSTQGPSHD